VDDGRRGHLGTAPAVLLSDGAAARRWDRRGTRPPRPAAADPRRTRAPHVRGGKRTRVSAVTPPPPRIVAARAAAAPGGHAPPRELEASARNCTGAARKAALPAPVPAGRGGPAATTPDPPPGVGAQCRGAASATRAGGGGGAAPRFQRAHHPLGGFAHRGDPPTPPPPPAHRCRGARGRKPPGARPPAHASTHCWTRQCGGRGKANGDGRRGGRPSAARREGGAAPLAGRRLAHVPPPVGVGVGGQQSVRATARRGPRRHCGGG